MSLKDDEKLRARSTEMHPLATFNYAGRLFACICILLICGKPVAYCQSTQSTKIWFAPRQDNVDRTQPVGHNVFFTKFDFPSMLAPDAAWKSASSHIALLSINLHTIQAYDNLPSVVAMTNRYSFKIATEGGMVNTGGLCEQNGMEGLDLGKEFATEIVNALKKWKQYGGRLDYVNMDSPFFFGYYASAKSCHFSIAEVARRAAATFKQIQLLYPNVRVMDAEGPGPTPIAAWLPDFKQWLADFAADSGHPIDAVGMDFQWIDAWHTGYDVFSAVRQTTDFLHRQGILAGLYINAGDNGISEAEWMKINRDRLRIVAQSNFGLDFVYLASWMKYPVHNLPETDPDAYTSLVDDAYRVFHGGR